MGRLDCESMGRPLEVGTVNGAAHVGWKASQATEQRRRLGFSEVLNFGNCETYGVLST